MSHTFTTYTGDQTVSAAAAALPQLVGYGTLGNLQVAMTQNPDLLSTVQNLTTSVASRMAFDNGVESALYAWAGASNVEAGSRGNHFDARKLAFLEAFTGETFRSQNGGANPSDVEEGQLLNTIWDAVLGATRARLLVQETGSSLSHIFYVDQSTDAITPVGGFNAIVADISDYAPTNASAAIYYWVDALSVLSNAVSDHAGSVADFGPSLLAALSAAAPSTFSNGMLSGAAAGTLTYVNVSGATSAMASEAVVNGSASPELFLVDVPGMRIVGGGGGDEFIVGRGAGNLSISETRATSLDNNTLYFAAGIATSDVTVSGNAAGDIVLTIGNTGEQITLESETNLNAGVQSLIFADGTVWTQQQLFTASTTGTGGNDLLYGSSSADPFDGKGGSDIEIGNGGGDVFVFNSGYGQLEINEAGGTETPANTLEFGSGIAPTDVAVSSDAAGDIILAIGTGDDCITLTGMLNGSANGVQQVSFANGTVWSRSDVLSKATTGTAGADTLRGSTGADTINGLGGTDLAIGRGGGDTFVFNAGYGLLRIEENDATSAINILQLGEGIDESDVSASANTAGDIILSIGTSGDSVVLSGMLNRQSSGVQSVVFRDGVSWNRQDLIVKAMTQVLEGNPGDDTLTGSAGADRFDGKGGSDVAIGGGGGDTFVFGAGYGHLEIKEVDYSDRTNNILEFGEGIAPSDISVSSDEAGNINLTVGDLGDLVSLDGMLNSVVSGIDVVTFSDGTRWTRQDLVNRATTTTSSDDVIMGTSAADTIDGRGGNDIAYGRGGSDLFVFNLGYGKLDINQVASDFSPSTSVLQLGPGIAPSDVSIASDQAGNAILSIGSNGDEIVIEGMAATPIAGVQFITFVDGTVWGRQQIEAAIPINRGTLGDNYLYGGAHGQIFDGLGGNDVEQGLGGGDTFIFNRGYGQLEIDESDNSFSPNNVLRFGSGIFSSDITVANDGYGSIVLGIGSDGDQVKIDNFLNHSSTGVPGVQSIVFADGTSWGYQQIIDRLQTEYITGTVNSDFLDGSAGADVIDGAGGSDQVFDEGGGDVFVFNRGYGKLHINETDGSGTPHNALQLGPSILPADVNVSGNGTGDFVLTVGNGDDQISLSGMLNDSQHGVQSVRFADGTIWNTSDLYAKATTGTTGSDSLYGSYTGNVLDGRGGTGTDRAIGNGGGDTFVFNVGYGWLNIVEADPSDQPNNVLQLGPGIAPTDIAFSTFGFPNLGDIEGAIELNIGTNGDFVRIERMLDDPGFGVQSIRFADGTIWSRADILTRAATGTSADDGITGTPFADTFDGKGGVDYVIGRGGGDTFIFNRGYGKLEIIEEATAGSPADTLRLGAGISPSEVTVSTNSSGDSILAIGTNGDQVALDSQELPGNGVQSVVFADGTVWSRDRLLGANTTGTTGDDILFGTTDAETFDGRGGADLASGNGGGDTFVFNAGYGSLEINEVDGAAAANNVLQFGSGIAPIDVAVGADYLGDLILTIGTSGDQVIVDGFVGSSNKGIQSISFADGTIWSRQTLLGSFTTGTTGDDRLFAPDGLACVFDGKGGNDTAYGSGLGDTYIFMSGYGSLDIHEPIATGSTLQFGAGICPVSVSASYQWGLFVLYDGISGDQITLENVSNGGGVQTVQFADGTVWTSDQIIALANESMGGPGDDYLSGSEAAEFFDGLGGNDVINGGGGNDIFRFGVGYGSLEIREFDQNLSPNNILELGAGINPSDVALSADADGDVVLTIGTSGDQVVLDGELLDPSCGVQEVVFADGTNWARGQLLVSQLSASTGDDGLFGTPGADVFDGLGGDDIAVGEGGSDTFVFDQGYGVLEINEFDPNPAPNNVLQFGAGILPADVSVDGDSDGLIVLTIGTNGDAIVLDRMRWNANAGVQTITFANGEQWSRQDVLDRLGASRINGTSASEMLFGTAAADTIDGAGGSDIVYGNGGGDTFIFKRGYGELDLYEVDSSLSANNRLVFGAGIDPGDVTVSADWNNIVLSIGDGGDAVWLRDMKDQVGAGVQSVVFAEGTVWSGDSLRKGAILGTIGNDSLSGTSGADIFDGAGGNDIAQGNGGNDTFLFNAGYGSLTIFEYDTALGANNVLQFGAGIDPNQMSVYADAYGDAVLLNNATSDVVSIACELYSDRWGPQSIQFSDGTTWNRQDVIDHVGIIGTNGNDTLTGTSGVDVFDGKGGSDLVQGNGGNDIFLFNAGYGNLTIYENDTSTNANNVLEFGKGVDPNQMSVYADEYGDAILINNATNDAVVIASELYSDQWGPQSIYFEDATWTRQDVIDRVGVIGSAANDTLTGTSGVDVFDGKGGSDHVAGNGGNDIFLFNTGYGNLVIDEVDAREGANNVLEFGSNISPSDILVSGNVNGDVILANNLNGDSVTLAGMLSSSACGVQSVYFANTTWTRQAVLAMVTG